MTTDMDGAEFAIAGVTAATTFVLADAADRYLATFDPSSTGDKPKDRFTSDGAGTLANTLNIARMPGWARAGVALGAIAVPAVAAAHVESPTALAAAQGAMLGAGVSAFQKLWNNLLMPVLIGKDTSTPALRESFIARLYPSETAAKINMDAQKGADGKALPGPYNPAGVLSGQRDVGPFALSDSSPYLDVDQALRRMAGLSGDSPYASASDALRRAAGVSGDSPYDDVNAALRRRAGVGYEPAGPPGQGPGPRTEPHKDSSACGCVGDKYAAFLGDSDPNSGESSHHTFADVRRAIVRETDAAGFRSNGMRR